MILYFFKTGLISASYYNYSTILTRNNDFVLFQIKMYQVFHEKFLEIFSTLFMLIGAEGINVFGIRRRMLGI